MLQSKIVRLAYCSSAPQMHLGVSSMPQRYKHVPKRPAPVLNLFCARLRGSSEPGGSRTVAQEVFTRGDLRSCGGLYVCSGGA